MRDRVWRILLLYLCLFANGLWRNGSSHGEEASPTQLDASVKQGLVFLARQQQADGSFVGFDDPGPRSAPTALALLAFLGCGHTPAAGEYNLVVHNAIGFLLRQAPDDGYLGRADGSGMEGQALITIALAECYGTENDSWQRKELEPTLRGALKAILAMQDPSSATSGGGWAAEDRGKADLATTALAVLALRSLDDAGMTPPASSLRHALEFARRSSANASPATAMILLLTDKNTSSAMTLQSLSDLKLSATSTDQFRSEFMLAYGGLRMHIPAASRLWEQAWESIHRQQAENGGWGTVQASATAVLTLSMQYRLMPLFNQ